MMRRLVYIAFVLLAEVSFGSGGYDMLESLENFDSLSTGAIDMQHEIFEWGCSVEMWNSQADTDYRQPSNCINVINYDSSNVLQLSNLGPDGGLCRSYSSMYFGNSNRLDSSGTIYLQLRLNGTGNFYIAFNGLLPGYLSDTAGDTLGDEGFFQGRDNLEYQASILNIGSDGFGAWHEDALYPMGMGIDQQKWYELWVQFDCVNQATRYYIAEAEEYASVVVNPVTGSQWWTWRNVGGSYIENMKLIVEAGDFPADVIIDNVSISPEFVTPTYGCPDCFLRGDADRDGDVDIYDFLILKVNYGTSSGASWEMGDFDGDSDVDIWDFLLLKSNYGKSGGLGNIDG